jgi:hypothetical protein
MGPLHSHLPIVTSTPLAGYMIGMSGVLVLWPPLGLLVNDKAMAVVNHSRLTLDNNLVLNVAN